MGKPKKGKKGRQDDDFGDDDVEVDPVAITAEQDAGEQKPAAAKKGKKGRRKKDDDWEDDIAAEISSLDLDGKSKEQEALANGEETQPKNKKKDKKKNKKVSFDESGSEAEAGDEVLDDTPVPKPKAKAKPAMSAFQMLAMDDDDDDDDEPLSEDEAQPVKLSKQPSLEDEDEPTSQQPQPKGKQKGKKGKAKGKKEEEEDIDALLAAMDEPEKKGKKKKKKGADDDEPPPPVPEETPGVDVSNMTQEEIAAMLDAQEDEEEDKRKKKKKKKGAVTEKVEVPDEEKEAEEGEEKMDDDDDEDSTVKTAAQKKKEKKERQRLQKLTEKEKGKKKGPASSEQAAAEPVEAASEEVGEPAAVEGSGDEAEELDKKKKKKDKKKKKKGEEEEEKEKEKEKKKKPVNKQVRAMQEALQKMKEEEERLEREEEEKERQIEEARIAKEEKERLEKEKKELAKQKKKEKVEKLKAEGKYMTAKQKEAQRRAQQMLEAMKAQGVALPQVDDTDKPKKKVVYENKKKKKQTDNQELASPTMPDTPVEESTPVISTEVPETAKEEEKSTESWEDIKDDWDASSDEEAEEKPAEKKTEEKPAEVKPAAEKIKAKKAEKEEEDDDEEEDEDEESEEDDSEEESSEEDSSDESSSEEEEKLTPAEKLERLKEKARDRLEKFHEQAEAKRTTDHLRAPVVVVLGHVDTGKTKILDKLRRTNVQDGEAGGITQQIGATNVPEHTIREQTKMCKDFVKKELKIPGLLIIDTPGHESFSNLRNRGSSLCDIAILVIDIMHGLEPQTIESIGLLKKRKTPFIVALNKIDRLFGWQTNPHADVQNTIKKQKPNTKIEFDERVQQAIVQLAEQGLNACLYYENKNPREYISLVPTSAHSGDGIGSLIALICDLTTTMLAKRLMWSEELQAITMEVKAIAGLGTTIDVILVNGRLIEGQTIVLGGTEGPIVTQIRGLLMPQPLKELRVKNAYEHHKEVMAAQGVKIIAKDLEKGLAGLPMYVANSQDEVEVFKEDVEEALGDILEGIKVQERGVYVQASTLGSLEALLEFLRTSKIPYAGINIGPVHRRDIMKASTMLEHDIQYAAILAFDVKIERDAQEMADNVGVRIFSADIIYHLFDQFMAHRANYKKQKQEEFKHIAVFPCKIRVMPQYVFNSRDPIVVGVIIEAGFVKEGMPLCVPSKEFLEIGRVTSIEINHKNVDMAKKGQEVCLKIEPIPGEAPKMFGRHFDEKDIVTSKISRESIDAVKNYFREEMSKADWQLMVELKKIFQIL